MQVREKVGKSRNTCVFPMICGSGGSKSRLAKAASAEPSRWELKNCTPLWREAHFQVKMCKTHHARSTFGSWDVEKVHAVVARSTFPSQNVQNTAAPDHFWKLRCRKSARRCDAKHISKSKCTKHHIYWRFRCCFAWQAQGIVHFLKGKTWGFCGISKNDGRRGTFEEDLQRCILRGRRSTQDMFIRDVRRSERWFPERGCILGHQICRFAKMILRDRCSTSYDLASLFRGRRSTLDRWSGKIAKRIGTRPSALHSTFHFWRRSRRIALYLMLSSSEIEDVSQNCFVLDAVKFKKWRCLAELLRFWCCQLRKMRKSRKIASVLMLSTLKNEEVSQNSWVFKLADRQVDR